MDHWKWLDAPLGRLLAASDGTALTGLWLEGQAHFAAALTGTPRESPELPVFLETEVWLRAYFSKLPLPPLPPLSPRGTPFRQAVWQMLLEIPYGTTVTYGELAGRLRERGVSASPRAVGGAVGHNPVSILIPCHRVVGSGGRLTGYAGGIAAKRMLLQLEGADINEP